MLQFKIQIHWDCLLVDTKLTNETVQAYKNGTMQLYRNPFIWKKNDITLSSIVISDTDSCNCATPVTKNIAINVIINIGINAVAATVA